MRNKAVRSEIDRVCIIFPGNVFTTPFLQRYTDILKEEKVDFDLVYWDAAGVKETTDATESYILRYAMSPLDSAVKKLIGYYRFYRMALKAIRSSRYKRVICLTTVPAVLLCKTLIKRYDGKYIVDIRDYFKEGNKIYFKKEKKAIEHSYLSVVSSPGFAEFLPEYSYLVAHNINWIDPEVLNKIRCIPNGKKDIIRLSYIGNMRFIELDKQLLSVFSNDNRFHINLIGKGYSILQEYCNEKGIKNVTIVDWFPPERTLEFYENTDIVLNLYGNGSPTVDYALSNKLYYAAQLRKPILVCPNTYMEKITAQYGFGFVFYQDDPLIKDKLMEFYNSINWSLFNHNCDTFLDDVRRDDNIFVEKVKEFLN